MTGKQTYFLKLIANRPTFVQDMTDEEKAIMQTHVGYLTDLLNRGTVKIFGPVFDLSGPYGMAVLQVDSEDEVREIIANDPASRINKYEYYPMQAVIAGK